MIVLNLVSLIAIVKPIGLDRFLKSINRLQTQIAEKKTNQNEISSYIFIKIPKKIKTKLMSETFYLTESQKDYIRSTIESQSF